MLYDNEALYIAIDCIQRGVPVVQRLTRRERGQAEADQVVLNLRTSMRKFRP